MLFQYNAMPSSSLEPSHRMVVSKDVVVADGNDDKWQRRRRCNEDTTTTQNNNNVLNLMMICCEENQPYGPPVDTANMFLELLCAAYEQHLRGGCATSREVLAAGGVNNDIPSKDYTNLTSIRITIYHAQTNDYPTTQEEWNSYNGIIIPGSLSAAYDTHIEWIHKLQSIIQTEIVAKQRKCLGVCFGHQCFAHSFELMNGKEDSDISTNDSGSKQQRRGSASKCTIGNLAGRKSFKLTKEGKFLLGSSSTISNKDCIDMLFTRGDMVESLPSVAVSLCGTDDSRTLPNEACAYFASQEEVYKFQHQIEQKDEKKLSVVDKSNSRSSEVALPYAITFQAHPEYMTSTGYNTNYVNTVKAMKDRGSITAEQEEDAIDDAKLKYEVLERDCLDAIVSTAVILRWF